MDTDLSSEESLKEFWGPDYIPLCPVAAVRSFCGGLEADQAPGYQDYNSFTLEAF